MTEGAGDILGPLFSGGRYMITGNILIGGRHVATPRTDPVKIWFFIVLGVLVATTAACWQIMTATGAV